MWRTDDRSVIERFTDGDPYVHNGLVTSWTIRPWTVVIGDALDRADASGYLPSTCLGRLLRVRTLRALKPEGSGCPLFSEGDAFHSRVVVLKASWADRSTRFTRCSGPSARRMANSSTGARAVVDGARLPEGCVGP